MLHSTANVFEVNVCLLRGSGCAWYYRFLLIFLYIFFTIIFHCRFCVKNYHPLDVKDEKQYVVGDEYTQPWEVSNGIRNIGLRVCVYIL